MMIRTLTYLLCLLVTSVIHSQSAEQVLTDAIGQLSSGRMVSGQMTVSVFYGDDLQQSDRGHIAMRGYNIYFDLPNYRVVADQELCWLIDKDGMQIEINKLEDQYLFKHPRAILDSLAAGAYAYDFEPDRPDHSSDQYYLHFKPVDNTDEVSKVRLSISKSNVTPSGLQIITRDGYRYYLAFEDLTIDSAEDATRFEMDAAHYPDYEIYDLRLD